MTADSPCEQLDWDTEFFGRRIARVGAVARTGGEMTRVVRWCAERQVDCLYYLVPADEVQAARVAEESRFHLVDLRVTLELTIDATAHGGRDQSRQGPVREAVAADIPGLKSIASTAHRQSRFHADPVFPRASCDALYETWIEKSCHGFADAVLVPVAAGAAVGYVTCVAEGERGRIVLVGLHEDARGQGLGRVLIDAALGWFAAQGLRSVSVVTQGRNVSALRLYERSGFHVRSVGLWYHRWFTASK